MMKNLKAEFVCENKEYLIARVKKAKLNYRAYRGNGKYIGRIIHIFGPVEKPYVKISIEGKYEGGKIIIRGNKNAKRKK